MQTILSRTNTTRDSYLTIDDNNITNPADAVKVVFGQEPVELMSPVSLIFPNRRPPATTAETKSEAATTTPDDKVPPVGSAPPRSDPR